MAEHVPDFVKDHNIACYLGDPPKGREEFKSVIVGLKTCRIVHALRENPVIQADWIKEFWRNADAKKTGSVIRSRIQNKEIIISEQTIREVLLFGDASSDPVEYPKKELLPVLERMSYEGTYPPTSKKLLHPYWRFLAHVYLVCISGNRGGFDVLNTRHTSAVVSLVMGWKFNYSRCIFEDMRLNVRSINEKYWLKFPRFLQLILDAKYSSLQRTEDTYRSKAMNHLVFGLIKQKRLDAKIVFEDKKPLEMFGKFAEIEGADQVQRKRQNEENENIDLTDDIDEEELDEVDYDNVVSTSEPVAQGVQKGVVIQECEAANVEDDDDDDDSLDEFDDEDVFKLQKRVLVLEQDKTLQDIQIASLLEEVTEKNNRIKELETDLGSLSVIVMDLKQKLEHKFGNDFAYSSDRVMTARKRIRQIRKNVAKENTYG